MKQKNKYHLRYMAVVIAGIFLVFCADYMGLFNGFNMCTYDPCFRVRGEKKTTGNIVIAAIGVGIKPENMDKLFRPFSQVESAYAQNFEGTGLGLTLTKKLVELHYGRIWVESEFGKGSRFVFVIPARQENAS